ncbi:MAG: SRPBCC family protein [Acidobacteriota bacterium]
MMNPLDFTIDENLATAKTLPASVYFGEEILALEKQRIFNRTWQLVGRLEQLPDAGSFFTTEIAGEPLVLVRGKDEKIRGFFNVCRHRAGPVANGTGCRKAFQCAYHGWAYALDGSLLSTPYFEGVEHFNKTEYGLVPVGVEVWEQFIFVSLDETSPPFGEFFADLSERIRPFNIANMQFVERRDYLIDCNWKVYVDNYLEGYHLPMVHPGLMQELDFANYHTRTFRYHSLQDAPIRKTSADDRTRRYESDGKTDALYFWVFPNLMVNLNPETLSTNLIIPLSPEKTLTIFEWFAHDSHSLESQQRMLGTVHFSDEIQQEDIEICEAVQRGLRSISYTQGRFSKRFENGVHHFHRLWQEFCLRNG